MYNFISILIGGLTAIMLTFNGILSQYTGNYISNIIIHLVGLTSLILILIFSKFKLNFKKGIPLIFYTGGAIGVFTVIFNNICITTIGATLTVSLGLLGQVVFSLIIDHFGFLGMNQMKFKSKKLIGLTLMTIGIIIMTIS